MAEPAAAAARRVTATRRRPRQARGQATVAAILDTADAMVAERGPEALSATAIAARGGMAAGTLYQYFTGVPEIVDALADRHAERFAVVLAARLRASRFTRKRDAANAALDAFLGHCRDHPGFLALWRAQPPRPAVLTGADRYALAGVVVAVLVEQGLVDPDDERFALEADIQWSLAVALAHLAFARNPDGDPSVLAHLRRLFDLDVVIADTRSREAVAGGDQVEIAFDAVDPDARPC